MQDPLQSPRALRFGGFEIDLESEELKKNGRILRLRSQPFRMLAIIAGRDGDVVTYEEIRTQLWPSVVIENYKHSLGNSLLEVRKVLNDSAENPLYIKTVSLGYRFLVPVQFIVRPSANGNGSRASLTVSLLTEIEQIGQEFISTSAYRGLTLLLVRCKGLCNQHPGHPDLPGLQLLMADIQSAIRRSAVLELGWANPTISNEVASLVFDDPNAISVPDPFVNGGWKTIGLVSESVLLVVEHTGHPEDGREVVRIHRARRATPQERRFYEQRRK
jgi:DNA-binding winged helix-turn-helix (wHTH) protein/uncharacterized DUF497 family protein